MSNYTSVFLLYFCLLWLTQLVMTSCLWLDFSAVSLALSVSQSCYWMVHIMTASWLVLPCWSFENNKLTYRLALPLGLFSGQNRSSLYKQRLYGHLTLHLFYVEIFDICLKHEYLMHNILREVLGVNKLQLLNLESIINPVYIYSGLYHYNVNWRDKTFIALMNIE